jgi:hypothetical protein
VLSRAAVVPRPPTPPQRPEACMEAVLRLLSQPLLRPADRAVPTVDPLLDQTEAPYSYTNDNPVNATDPLGLDGWGWNLTRRVAIALGLTEDYFSEYREAFVIERIQRDPALRDRLYARWRATP